MQKFETIYKVDATIYVLEIENDHDDTVLHLLVLDRRDNPIHNLTHSNFKVEGSDLFSCFETRTAGLYQLVFPGNDQKITNIQLVKA